VAGMGCGGRRQHGAAPGAKGSGGSGGEGAVANGMMVGLESVPAIREKFEKREKQIGGVNPSPQ